MKRSPLKRKAPLRRGGRIKPRNEERTAKRRERDFGRLADYVRALSCCACMAPGPSDPAHVTSRGAGGHAWNEDGTGNIIPLCRGCHTAQHSHGWGHVFRYGKPHAKSIAVQVGKDFRLLQFSEKTGNESGAPW